MECRNCGYTPTEHEAQQGSCPHCTGSRHLHKEFLEKTLDTLQVGDSVQVLSTYAAHQPGRPNTVYLWVVGGRHPNGQPLWKSCGYGPHTFLDSDRQEHTVWVSGLSEVARRYFAGETASVIHFTLGEMTYRASYVIHRVRPPTDAELARERLVESINPQQAA